MSICRKICRIVSILYPPAIRFWNGAINESAQTFVKDLGRRITLVSLFWLSGAKNQLRVNMCDIANCGQSSIFGRISCLVILKNYCGCWRELTNRRKWWQNECYSNDVLDRRSLENVCCLLGIAACWLCYFRFRPSLQAISVAGILLHFLRLFLR